MHYGEQKLRKCPNCSRNIIQQFLNIHVIKCTSKSLRRSGLYSSTISRKTSKQQEMTSEAESVSNAYLNHSGGIRPMTYSAYPQSQTRQQPSYMPCEAWIQPFDRKQPLDKKQPFDRKNVVNCHFCMEVIAVDLFEDHAAVCQQRLISCPSCRDMFPLPLIQEHKNYYCLQRDQGRDHQSGLKDTKLHTNMKRIHQFEDKMGNHLFSQSQTSYQPQKQQQSHYQRSIEYIRPIISGVGLIGSHLVSKGFELGKKAKEFFQSNRQHALQKLEQFHSNLMRMLESAIIAYAEESNHTGEGMNSHQIDLFSRRAYVAEVGKEQPDLCTICYCELEDEEEVLELKCQHLFHSSCIEKWLKINRTCPLCKQDQRTGSWESNGQGFSNARFLSRAQNIYSGPARSQQSDNRE